MTILFPIIYSAALTYLVWKAFKVMSNGWGISDNKNKSFSASSFKQKKYTIHPELLDKSGNLRDLITAETIFVLNSNFFTLNFDLD